MLMYCYEKWNANREKLEAKFRGGFDFDRTTYQELLALTVECIFNDGDSEYNWDTDGITEIDNGDYQGTLLYLIPQVTYPPSEYEYLMTYIGYGSCSCCDLLRSIQPCGTPEDEDLNKVVTDFMSLCKSFVTNMVKPYNCGWRNNSRFEHIKMEVNTDDRYS